MGVERFMNNSPDFGPLHSPDTGGGGSPDRSRLPTGEGVLQDLQDPQKVVAHNLLYRNLRQNARAQGYELPPSYADFIAKLMGGYNKLDEAQKKGVDQAMQARAAQQPGFAQTEEARLLQNMGQALEMLVDVGDLTGEPVQRVAGEEEGVRRPTKAEIQRIEQRAREMAFANQKPTRLQMADAIFTEAFLKAKNEMRLLGIEEGAVVNKVDTKWGPAEYKFTPGAGRFPVTMEIPVLAEDKIAWMRDLLRRIEEKGADVNNDPSFRQEMENMYAAITFLVSEEYRSGTELKKGMKVPKDKEGNTTGDPYEVNEEENQKKTIGEKMHDEFIHRLSFHNAFLAFTDAGDENKLGEVLSKVGGDVQNILLRTPEFAWLSFYFELNPEAYNDTLARNPDGSIMMEEKDGKMVPAFISDDEAHERFRKKAEAWLVEQAQNNPEAWAAGIKAENASWAARLVERKFRMDGRRATFAEKYTTPERKSKITGRMQTGYKFKDNVDHGDEVLRKALRMQEWAESDDEAENLKANWKLVEDVDWKTNDYVQELMSDKVIDAVRKATMGKDERGNPRPYNPDGSPTFVDLTKAFFIVKNNAPVYLQRVKIKGEMVFVDPSDPGRAVSRKLVRFDFRKIDWKRVDMGEDIGGSSMDYWVGKRIKTMGAVREVLIGKPDSGYLRTKQPSEETLLKMNEVLGYQKDDRWGNLMIMAKDYVNWKASQEYKEQTGYKPLNAAEKEVALLRLSAIWGLSPEQTEKTMEDALGREFKDNVILFYYRYNVGSAFLAFIWAIISGVGGAAMNPKAA